MVSGILLLQSHYVKMTVLSDKIAFDEQLIPSCINRENKVNKYASKLLFNTIVFSLVCNAFGHKRNSPTLALGNGPDWLSTSLS